MYQTLKGVSSNLQIPRMNKFDCLVYEMLLIRELTPSLNVQSNSIQAKLFA